MRSMPARVIGLAVGDDRERLERCRTETRHGLRADVARQQLTGLGRGRQFDAIATQDQPDPPRSRATLRDRRGGRRRYRGRFGRARRSRAGTAGVRRRTAGPRGAVRSARWAAVRRSAPVACSASASVDVARRRAPPADVGCRADLVGRFARRGTSSAPGPSRSRVHSAATRRATIGPNGSACSTVISRCFTSSSMRQERDGANDPIPHVVQQVLQDDRSAPRGARPG